MKTPIFRGAATAIATPFTESGVNYPEFGRLIDFNIDNGIDAIVVCGTTGESATMPDKEHIQVASYCIERVAGRVPVIVGTGSNDTAHGMALSKAAAAAGADGLLLVTPYYNKATQKGLVRHFSSMAESAGLPVILYNVPSRTGLNIAPETYKELSHHPLINAVKEAGGDISHIAKTRALCGDELLMYSGNDDQIVPLLSLGSLGVISVLSNIVPRETHDICQLFFDGKVTQSAALQLKLLELINALFCEVNPIPVKKALTLMGFEMGPLRAPLYEMEPQNVVRLKAAMTEQGLL